MPTCRVTTEIPAFAAGLPTTRAWEWMALHVEICPDCSRALASQSNEADSVIQALREVSQKRRAAGQEGSVDQVEVSVDSGRVDSRAATASVGQEETSEIPTYVLTQPVGPTS